MIEDSIQTINYFEFDSFGAYNLTAYIDDFGFTGENDYVPGDNYAIIVKPFLDSHFL